jgi:hypothetical protein
MTFLATGLLVGSCGAPASLSPHTAGDVSSGDALTRRRSAREPSGEPPSRTEIGQLLWAAQGMTLPVGHRLWRDTDGTRMAPAGSDMGSLP